MPKPDLVVYLQAPTEVLMKRVKARGRPEETGFSEEYLAEVNRAYNHYFFHYSATPLLVVNTADVDFVKNPEDTDDLLKQIRGMGKGTQYYVPRSRSPEVAGCRVDRTALERGSADGCGTDNSLGTAHDWRSLEACRVA